jgi:PIN domain nuclease of toxin-antitoxin system
VQGFATGKPLVKVVRLDAPSAGQIRRLGFMAGQITVPDDFDSMGAKEIELLFSAASLWEIVIKRGIGRSDFQVDARVLRRGLLDNGYQELAITSKHTVSIDSLPPIHKDPFDRILVAQATVEGITLLTGAALVAKYPGPVRQV